MRFLFVISDVGGGHRSSAVAVSKAMQLRYGGAAEIELVDILLELDRWPYNRAGGWYGPSTRLGGAPYSAFWHLTNHVGLIEALSRLNWRYLWPALERFLARHAADVVVSFYPVMNHVLVRALREAQLPAPMVSVVVDMVTVHASWFVSGAQSWVVPTEEARQAALRHRVPPERISVAGGMPVRQPFVEARGTSQAEARECLGVDSERPLVLVVGGGEGMGPLEAVVRALVARLPETRIVAVTGRNQGLYERLISQTGAPNLRLEGFVADMELWMRAADVMVTKAGPNLLCEAFVCGLPLVLYAAVPGQEEGNVIYVVKHGAGVWAPRPRKAAQAVAELLADPERRQEMADRSAVLAGPEAADRIAQHVWAVGETLRLGSG